MRECLQWGGLVWQIILAAALAVAACACAGAPQVGDGVVRDKTLVVWAAVSDLKQQGGSALTLDDGGTIFDGVVFGELAPARWMPGSEGYLRTQREQEAWPAETAGPDEFVQVAVSYRGKEVSLYRNGALQVRYTMGAEPASFGPSAVVLFGKRHTAAGTGETFAGRIRDARIYASVLEAEAIGRLKPGSLEGGPAPWAWWSFADEGLRERTGRFTEIRLTGDVKLSGGCLELAGKGAAAVMTTGVQGANAGVPQPWGFTGPVPDAALQSARLLRERLLADPWRPGYHFCVPEDMGEPGDPNGAFYADGRYHLMYLYNRSGSGFCWGHISSADLLHWRHQPDGIGPGGSDEGCFSGGGFVDDDGAAYLSYWMLWGPKGIGVARSAGPPYDVWQKSEANPIIRSTEFGLTETTDATGKPLILGSADPSNIWKRDGKYYILTGNLLVLNKIGRAPDAPLSEQGDRLYLFESTDLKSWTYRHVFYQRKPEWTDRSEDNMCPSFLPLPSSPDGGKASGKHLLLFISHNRGCQFYVGAYRDDHFLPESHGRMTWVDNTYFAPEALVDGKGRQIMWSWLTDNPGGDKAKGWSGVFGLPRTLWVGSDGTLRMRPVAELERLRLSPKVWRPATLADAAKPLEGVKGDSCEIALQIDPGTAQKAGVKVRASAGGEEETLLYYDAAKRALVMDSTRSGVAGRKVVESAPLELKRGEPLRLRVFVDKSVIEVYANDRQAIGRRVFPGRPDSLGVAIYAEGGTAKFSGVKAWEMAASNPF